MFNNKKTQIKEKSPNRERGMFLGEVSRSPCAWQDCTAARRQEQVGWLTLWPVLGCRMSAATMNQTARWLPGIVPKEKELHLEDASHQPEDSVAMFPRGKLPAGEAIRAPGVSRNKVQTEHGSLV